MESGEGWGWGVAWETTPSVGGRLGLVVGLKLSVSRAPLSNKVSNKTGGLGKLRITRIWLSWGIP